jgi:hypothetical protein
VPGEENALRPGHALFHFGQKLGPIHSREAKVTEHHLGGEAGQLGQPLLGVERGANLPVPVAQHPPKRAQNVLLVVDDEKTARGGGAVEGRLHGGGRDCTLGLQRLGHSPPRPEDVEISRVQACNTALNLGSSYTHWPV